MFEKVNPSHPDKVMDRIAGAIVDLAYRKNYRAIIAVEGILGHGHCHIICESNVDISAYEVEQIVHRITGDKSIFVDFVNVKQDEHLAENQNNLPTGSYRCGDNGIFRGAPVTDDQRYLTKIAKDIYDFCPSDGKYILSEDLSGRHLILCQSNVKAQDLYDRFVVAKFENDSSVTYFDKLPVNKITINPLGSWTGGPSVDTGAVNRKLGSDMGDSVTGGGIFGKDVSKADVSINIYVWLQAQSKDMPVTAYCAIGDTEVLVECDGEFQKVPFDEMIYAAQNYIRNLGGYEKFAEWGLIR